MAIVLAPAAAACSTAIVADADEGVLTQTITALDAKVFDACNHCDMASFCPIDGGPSEGVAKFLMIWRHTEGQWRMTRVVSYGHRPLPSDQRASTAAPAATVAR